MCNKSDVEGLFVSVEIRTKWDYFCSPDCDFYQKKESLLSGLPSADTWCDLFNYDCKYKEEALPTIETASTIEGGVRYGNLRCQECIEKAKRKEKKDEAQH